MALTDMLGGAAGGGGGGGGGYSTSSTATATSDGKSGNTGNATFGDFAFKTQSASGAASTGGGLPPYVYVAAALAFVAFVWFGPRK